MQIQQIRVVRDFSNATCPTNACVWRTYTPRSPSHPFGIIIAELIKLNFKLPIIIEMMHNNVILT